MSRQLPRFAASTHVGCKRDHNEDAYLADPDLGLFMVADGMGGHEAGEVASQLACENVRSAVQRGSSLVDALRAAHDAILAHAQRDDAARSMGATGVALRVDATALEVAWVGDSRAYLFDQSLGALTRDHSYVGELMRQGVIDASQARKHPQRNVVTQALGAAGANGLEVGFTDASARAGNRILLCSDGLTEVVTDEEIGRVLGDPDRTLQQCVDMLMDAALAGGGPDNVTVIVVELAERAAG